MTRIKHLQLVLPKALAQLRAPDVANRPNLVLLDWLRTGTSQRLWEQDDLLHARLNPWQHSLLHALPSPLRDQGLASAMLYWRGEGRAWRKGTGLHAELVHLAAGVDDLRLLLPPPPTPAEEQQLLASLQPLLSLSGFELQMSPSGQTGRWYLFTERSLSLTTYSPYAGFATRIFDIMPQGADGPELRRLMTETQMLLHDHPVNAQRARQGIPGLNALWLWGAAPLGLATQSAPQRVLSNDPYVQGLCEHLHLNCWPLGPDAQAVLSVAADQLLLVLPDEDVVALNSSWMLPLQAALQRGDIEQLDLHLDHWRISLQGGRWRQAQRWLTRNRTELNELLA